MILFLVGCGASVTSNPGAAAPPIVWHNLLVSLPAAARWQPEPDGWSLKDFPVLAAATVRYPPADAGVVEVPAGLTLLIVNFNGTLQDWLALERVGPEAAAGSPEEAVHETTVAGLPAITYRRTFLETLVVTYYLVDLDGDTTVQGGQLLFIRSEGGYPENEEIIRSLRLQASP